MRRVSGQCINFDKSSIFFGKKCPVRLKGKLAHILGVRQNKDFGKYLGLNADFGASKRAVFETVHRRIASKLMGWSEQYLSPAGKEVLIKAVAMAMPNYSMSCFKLPVSLCKEIERDIATFWWKVQKDRRGIHWVSWQRLCQFKKAGGMGFRDLICFNLAMLAKLVGGYFRTRIPCLPGSYMRNIISNLISCMMYVVGRSCGIGKAFCKAARFWRLDSVGV